jgi:hypothetical protein
MEKFISLLVIAKFSIVKQGHLPFWVALSYKKYA